MAIDHLPTRLATPLTHGHLIIRPSRALSLHIRKKKSTSRVRPPAIPEDHETAHYRSRNVRFTRRAIHKPAHQKSPFTQAQADRQTRPGPGPQTTSSKQYTTCDPTHALHFPSRLCIVPTFGASPQSLALSWLDLPYTALPCPALPCRPRLIPSHRITGHHSKEVTTLHSTSSIHVEWHLPSSFPAFASPKLNTLRGLIFSF